MNSVGTLKFDQKLSKKAFSKHLLPCMNFPRMTDSSNVAY